MPESSPVWTVSFTIIIGFFVGGGLGFGASYWPRLGVLIIGLSIGALLGACIYVGVVEDTDGALNEDVVFWMSVLASGVLTGIICLIFYDYAVIIGSAIMGSYLFIRGISFIIDSGYPGEIQMIMNITNGTFNAESMSIQFMTYLSFMILLFIISMVIQIKMRSAH